MSILGSIFSCDNIVFNCFRPKAKDEDPDRYNTIFESAKNNQIIILPVLPNHETKSLFPLKNNVRNNCSVILFGKRREVIHCKLTKIFNYDGDELLDHRDDNKLPKSLREFFDTICTYTIDRAKQLKLIIIYNSVAFLSMSYPLFDEKHVETVGALLLLTEFQAIAENNVRLSVDLEEKKISLKDAAMRLGAADVQRNLLKPAELPQN